MQLLTEILAPYKSILDLFNLTELDVFFGIVVTPVLFFFFWKLMGAMVFGPFIALTEAREAATAGAQGSADALLKDIAQREKKLEEALHVARAEALAKRAQEVSQSSKEAQGIVSKAENEAKDFLKASREETEKQKARLREELFAKSEELVQSALQAVTKAPKVITQEEARHAH